MYAPVYHSAAYQAWMQQIITESQETVRRSQELVARTDEYLATVRVQAKRADTKDDPKCPGELAT